MRMGEAGIFRTPMGDARVELIEGEVLEMTPPGPLHSELVGRLTEWCIQRFSGSASIRVQSPLVLREQASVPEPDIAVLRRRSYRDAHPRAEDVLLAIEVGDSSLQFDRERKGRVYASAGIGEYWLVNARDSVIQVFRGPAEDGYESTTEVGRNGALSPLAFPDVELQPGVVLFDE